FEVSADGLSDEMELAYQALLQLGYRDKEARTVLERLEMDMQQEGTDIKKLSAADLIAAALRRM
ncbi:MAG: hypothetical protein KDK30_06345, partial [Leptospiraceae bacterium]|nr:hypothetical protein [Leptospiraceae bacterium]